MSDENIQLANNFISLVIRQKYGDLLDWKKPELEKTVGPYLPNKWDDFEAALHASIDNKTNLLKILGHKELVKRYKPTGSPNPSFFLLRKDLLDAANPNLDLTIPYIFAGGFGVKDMEADFGHWVRMGSWSLIEATAVSIGIEPKGNLAGIDLFRTTGIECFEFYTKRRNLLRSKFFQFGDNTMLKPKPADVMHWMKGIKLEVPIKLYQTYNDVFFPNEPKKDSNSGELEPRKLMEARERASLLRLVVGMAVGGYGYDPKSKRSPIPNQIRDDLVKLGLDLHQDTIRRYLNEATNILPKKLKDE